MKQLRLLLTISLISSMYGCASKLQVLPQSVSDCDKTSITFDYKTQPNDEWVEHLNKSISAANQILSDNDFALACSNTWMTNKRGNSASKVCEQLVCGGNTVVQVGFYDDPNSAGIATTGMNDRVMRFNTAKMNQGSGTPGNIIHEYTHVLGYKHLTNFRFIAQTSVPYKVGYLADKYADTDQ
ncbi:hypothetical protein EYS14_01045 [Alteromonadaceae bacterium M269]|nr:hypothetical protein EYS14_01045 [Alteromonadaceae bacterium M269]